jgi:hypothetical protein
MLPAVAKTAAVVARASGVAVGLGLGAAAVIALAAPASAAPADAHATSDATATRSAKASPTTRAAAVRTRSNPAPAATRTAPTRVVVPSSVARRPTVTSPTLGRRAVGVTAAQTPAPLTPASDFLSSLFSCDPRGRLITIYKGTHFAIPNSFGLFTQSVAGSGTFTADTSYDLGDEDQYDWNKFTGIAFTPLEPDRDSVMVGWRYNLSSGNFEIAPFYNVDKKRILPNEQTEVISVPAGQTFQFAVDYNGVTISYGGKSVYKPFPSGLTANVWTAARVSGWFGGNEVAPRTVSYYLNIT